MQRPGGRILCTYLHGPFDNPGLRRALLRNLAPAKGRGAAGHQWRGRAAWGQLASLDEQFDRLAGAVRASVDVGRIYRIARSDRP